MARTLMEALLNMPPPPVRAGIEQPLTEQQPESKQDEETVAKNKRIKNILALMRGEMPQRKEVSNDE